MSYDGDAHETRRNVLLGVGLSILAVLLVGGMFWVMSSLTRPAVTGTASVARATTSADASATAPAPVVATTASVAPTVGTWTNTVTLPPGEQPTLTAPVAGQTADGVPAPATTTAPPAPAPKTTAPAPAPTSAPPPPAAPSVTNVHLACAKDSGKRITATLTFTTTTRVDVTLSAGGSVQRGQAGPGDISLTASGRGAELCVAQVAGQTVGPVPAT
ncbi:MAG: hypothetical protein ABJA89_13690 [Lapillicoccus sp.]